MTHLNFPDILPVCLKKYNYTKNQKHFVLCPALRLKNHAPSQRETKD